MDFFAILVSSLTGQTEITVGGHWYSELWVSLGKEKCIDDDIKGVKKKRKERKTLFWKKWREVHKNWTSLQKKPANIWLFATLATVTPSLLISGAAAGARWGGEEKEIGEFEENLKKNKTKKSIKNNLWKSAKLVAGTTFVEHVMFV